MQRGQESAVTTRRTKERCLPPDYVSARTLAYRLDCSRSTIDDYVRRGLLPKPINIGTLQRWRWNDIEFWIVHTSVGFSAQDSTQAAATDEEDAYLVGVERATTSDA
jgi:predicted DNA-binding transcriptional regulator AlpA